jgi:hypothetical protein
MARSEKRSTSKQAIPLTIAEETAIFLKSGGKIQQIPTGISGQVNLAGPKHIKLGNNNKPSETKPVETKPIETESIETKPIEAESIETKSIETESIDTKPIEASEATTESVKPN